MIMWEQLDDLNFVDGSALLPRSRNQTQEKKPLMETTVSTLRRRNNEYWNIKTLFFFSHFYTCNNYIIYVIMDARVTRMVPYCNNDNVLLWPETKLSHKLFKCFTLCPLGDRHAGCAVDRIRCLLAAIPDRNNVQRTLPQRNR